MAAPLLLISSPALRAQVAVQQEADGYSRYELLEPGSGKFRILYEISAVTAGATSYFNPIRPGSIATDERVVDRATGQALRWEVVDGAVARAGGVRGAEPGNQFIQVHLARPVPQGGEARVLIDKTYEDRASYRMEGETIVFDRSLGVKRNAVVLPPGYALVSVNYPSQVIQEAGGRTTISFWNATPAPAPLVVKARPAARKATTGGDRVAERAAQSSEIIYYLQQPETNSFALTHDYTESRPGVGHYVNIVRAGSKASNPSATLLDTGEALRWEMVQGEAIRRWAPDASGISAETQGILFHFPPAEGGQSRRLRIAETYTDSESYRLSGDRLVWRRALGRPANAVVLPEGWSLVSSSMPAIVSETAEGKARLDFINPRPDQLDVEIIASRR